MKKSMCALFVAVIALCGVAFTVNNAQALDCASMRVMLISADAANGGAVWLRNDTGAACGAIVNGGQQFFALNPAEVDKLMAVALTAVSLQKNVWVSLSADTAGSLVNVMAIQNN